MKRLGWMILVAALFAAVPLVATENLIQCITNCPPGNNSCSQCCLAQYEAGRGPCDNACQTAQNPCLNAAWQSCQNNQDPQNCYQLASSPCQQALFNCQRNCDGSVQIAGGCPGEVPPQKCPYDCQMWNPASQSCIGPTMNGCGNMTMATHATTLTDIMAARAKTATDAAAAHTEKLVADTAAKKKTKKK